MNKWAFAITGILAGFLVQAENVPGGIAVIGVAQDTSAARFQRHDLLLLDYRGDRFAIVGLPLKTKTGAHELLVQTESGGSYTLGFSVADKAYREQHLTIKNKRMVDPLPQDMERISRESKLMRDEYLSFNPLEGNPLPFNQPLSGIITSEFGFRRVLNGKPRNPHSGLDLDATTGTPIASPAPGIITLADEYFFNGNTVFINHGSGLISMVCHLSEIQVEVNQRVERGDIVGLVGATGRVTGPHLHWSVSLNGNRVNPLDLVNLQSRLKNL